jgi:hypothetical protein
MLRMGAKRCCKQISAQILEQIEKSPQIFANINQGIRVSASEAASFWRLFFKELLSLWNCSFNSVNLYP